LVGGTSEGRPPYVGVGPIGGPTFTIFPYIVFLFLAKMRAPAGGTVGLLLSSHQFNWWDNMFDWWDICPTSQTVKICPVVMSARQF